MRRAQDKEKIWLHVYTIYRHRCLSHICKAFSTVLAMCLQLVEAVPRILSIHEAGGTEARCWTPGLKGMGAIVG